MDDDPCRLFFTAPSCPAQRQYEALRAVFVEGLSRKEAAERFGYSHDALRQLVGRFRVGLASGNAPPFSFHNVAGVRRGRRRARPARPSRPSPPTRAS